MKHLLFACSTTNIVDVLKLAKSVGAGVEIQDYYSPSVLFAPERIIEDQLALLKDFTGVRAVHGPFGDLCPGSFDPQVREVAHMRIQQVMPVVAKLGAQHLILHHGYVPNTSNPDNWVVRSTEFWQKVLAELPAGVTIHLENHNEATPELVLRLVQQVNDLRLGICLDIGHAHAFSRWSAREWVEALGTQLTYVHLHDNDGSGDQHLPLGAGNIPLMDVFTALEAHAPQAIWAIETQAAPSLAWLREQGIIAPA